MSEVSERLAKLSERVDDALQQVESDGGASPVLVAVVQELQRKMSKALGAMDDGNEREAVVEVEQAADSAKYAAEADTGLGEAARTAVIEAHDRICVLKAKMGS